MKTRTQLLGAALDAAKKIADQQEGHYDYCAGLSHAFAKCNCDAEDDHRKLNEALAALEAAKEEPDAFVEIRLYDQGERKQPDTVTLPRELVEKALTHIRGSVWAESIAHKKVADQLTAALQQPTKTA